MNHTQILKRAWNILWSYRTLWVFGILLALTGAGYNGPEMSYRVSDRDLENMRITPPEDVMRELQRLGDGLERIFDTRDLGVIWGVIATLICLFFVMAVVFTVINNISKTALIRMVDQYEASEEKLNWKQGLRLGWSRAALRLFLIDVVIYLPVVVVFVALFASALVPVMMAEFAIILTIGAAAILTFLAIIVGVLISVFMEMIRRTCVLQETGVIEAIRLGVELVRGQFKDVFLMWLVLVGVRIAYTIVIIPIALLVVGLGLLVGGGSGFLVYSLVQAAGDLTAAIVAGIVLGGALFVLTLMIPLGFLDGLRETFTSTAWTLTYRELKLAAPVEADEMFLEDVPAEG